MGKRRDEKTQVASIYLVDLNVGIINADRPSLGQHLLEQRNHRTLAQVIRVFLKGEPKHADALCRQVLSCANGALQVLLIARQHRFEQR